MALTTAGRDLIAKMIKGDTHTPFNGVYAHIGVGNGNTAFAAGQTDLVGASKKRKGMNAGSPTLSTNVLTYTATFDTGDANFAWNEWGVFNSSATGTMLNRSVTSLGTKGSDEAWKFTVSLTVVAA